eukprot:3859143-Amphidinium_carterae.1
MHRDFAIIGSIIACRLQHPERTFAEASRLSVFLRFNNWQELKNEWFGRGMTIDILVVAAVEEASNQLYLTLSIRLIEDRSWIAPPI